MLKCPSCASSLRFDIESQKLHCDYCSRSFEPDLYDTMTKDAVLQADLAESRPGKTGLYETAVWVCPGCGAVLTYADDTDVTSVCAYCGNRNIMFERIRGERRPDSIVPFTVTKKDCIKRYRALTRRAFLSPGYLRRKSQTESFRGIYMPYFDYYAALDEDITFESEAEVYRSSAVTNYEVRKYDAHVRGKVLGQSHDASIRFSDDISESLGGFPGKRPFTPGYLSGFYAETDDAGVETHKPSGIEVHDKICDAIADSAYELSNKPESTETDGQPEERIPVTGTIDMKSIKFKSKNIRAERTLYPVWFMSHRMKNGKLTYAAVNGSTGTVAADFPLSLPRVLLFALGIALVLFLFLNLSKSMPRPIPATGICLVLFAAASFISSFVLESKLKRLNSGSTYFGSRAVRSIMIFLFGICAAVGFFGGGSNNNVWRTALLMGFFPFLIERLLAKKKASKLVKRIDMEETQVTYRDIRFMKRAAKFNLWFPIIVYLATFGIMAYNVVNEIYYYTATASAICFIPQYLLIIAVNNFFSYRRPLQFNKKGGDDSAH